MTYRTETPAEARHRRNTEDAHRRDVQVEAPLTVGFLLDIARQADQHALADAVEAALQAATEAAVDELRQQTGNPRLQVEATAHRYAAQHQDIPRPHAHLLFNAAGIEPRELDSVAQLVQSRYHDQLTSQIENTTEGRFVAAPTAAGRELAGLTSAVADCPRIACSIGPMAVVPLDRTDRHAA